MNKISWIICLTILLAVGCKRETVSDDVLSPVPKIALESITPTTAKARVDEIVFEIFYQDGDGDLGASEDVKNVFIRDLRIDNPHTFHLQQLAPSNANVPIQGIFKVNLPFTILTDGATSQNVSFDIYVVDRAGNQSNIITTPEIVVEE